MNSFLNICFFIAILSTSSCIGQYNGNLAGLEIFDMASSKKISVFGGQYREVVLGVSDARQRFCSLERMGTNLLFRERDYNGVVVAKSTLPLFIEDYADSRVVAISPDWSRMVFFDQGTHILKLMSLTSHQETNLINNLVPTAAGITRLEWLASNQILVLVSDIIVPGNVRSEIIKVDVETGRQEVERKLFAAGILKCSLSTNRRLLAFVEMGAGDGISIYDVQKMQVVRTLPQAADNQMVGSVFWLENNSQLVFTEVGSRNLFCYDLNNKKTDILVNGDGIISIFIAGVAANHVIFATRSSDDDNGYKYYVMNILTKHSKFLGSNLNGGVFSIQGGQKLLLGIN